MLQHGLRSPKKTFHKIFESGGEDLHQFSHNARLCVDVGVMTPGSMSASNSFQGCWKGLRSEIFPGQ